MTMIAENTPDCSDQDSGLPIPESQARQLRPGLSAGERRDVHRRPVPQAGVEEDDAEQHPGDEVVVHHHLRAFRRHDPGGQENPDHGQGDDGRAEESQPVTSRQPRIQGVPAAGAGRGVVRRVRRAHVATIAWRHGHGAVEKTLPGRLYW